MLKYLQQEVRMERKIYRNLLNWKNSDNRQPLILQGARQVGKTYIVNMFGQNEYINVVYCNFETEKGLKEFFVSLEPKSILSKIQVYKRKEIIPEKTLIIFDEVQACPEALTSLKYFNESANEYHIIATGSLLGIAVNRGNNSFPVGKVQFLTMYPMDFEEFLFALNENYSTAIEMTKECYATNQPMAELFHNELSDLYKQYLLVGGMPAVVDTFARTGNYSLARIKQQEILQAYFNDMSKYNKASEIPKTRLVYGNITTQLAKENKKFQYKLLKSGARATEYENAIEWLCLSGIAHKIHRLERVCLPLEANKSVNDFKFYMNDVGLCCAAQEVFAEDIFNDALDFAFKGGLAENYVSNQLIANGQTSYYWTSKSDAEIDFVTRLAQDIIPIEVKWGLNTRSRSISSYINANNPNYVMRISAKNFGFENNIKSIPLYAAFCIKK